ncbi:MAG: twin-arginine translocase subunit TatC [Acidimicrobiia bacterium]|nr:twin-arginine translocase subunit TatC [Acidimicrobiia bacterium]
MTEGARGEPVPVEEQRSSLLSHLEELRWRVFKMFIAVIVGAIAAFVFTDQLRDILQAPFESAAPGFRLQALTVTEEWGVLMRVALFGGVILASPVVLYQVWAFVHPALTKKEKKWAIPIVSALVILFIGGVLFGYTVLPKGLDFLLGVFDEVDNNLRIGDYYSFTLRFLLAFGLAFLYPVFLFAAGAAGIVSSEQLARGRRWAVLAVVVAAALITPTGDVLNLMILAVPLYLMYEVTYWLIRLILKK